MDGSDEGTLHFYAKEAVEYAKVDWAKDGHLQRFLPRLIPGARILELGCGGGRDTQAMLAQGFDVDPTDGVPEMALQAEARIGRPVRVLRFEELDAAARYDAVWAHASLLHAPWSDLPNILQRIWRALKPGGHHFANFKVGDHEGRDRFGRYYNYPSKQALLDLYEHAADWKIIDIEEGEGGGYDGVVSPWIAVTVRKPDLRAAESSLERGA